MLSMSLNLLEFSEEIVRETITIEINDEFLLF